MPRFFTLEQAQALLPSVQAQLRELIALKAQFQQLTDEMQETMRRIHMMGGTQVNPEQIQRRQDLKQSVGTSLNSKLEQIHSTGCLVKDLDMGLLDFPTLYRGEEVYLCWKLGEDRIEFWHGVTEGFRGRRPIDPQFVEQLQGD